VISKIFCRLKCEGPSFTEVSTANWYRFPTPFIFIGKWSFLKVTWPGSVSVLYQSTRDSHVPRPGVHPSTPVKCYSNSLLIAIWNLYIAYLNCSTWLSECMCLLTSLGFRSNITCKSATCKSACLNHVGVTNVERLGQGHLHPLLEQPRQTCHCRDLNQRPPAPCTGGHSSNKLFKNLTLFAIQNLYMAPPVFIQDFPSTVVLPLSSRSVYHSCVDVGSKYPCFLPEDHSEIFQSFISCRGHHYGEIRPKFSPSSDKAIVIDISYCYRHQILFQ
jgi:hypothetical protein